MPPFRSALMGGLALMLVGPFSPAGAEQQGSAALEQLMQMAPPQVESAACPSRQQVFADEVLRLHTQLMVTGILCGSAYGEPELEQAYRRFTETHVQAILNAEALLSNQPIVRSAEVQDIDDYRTLLANQEAGEARSMSPSVYCQARQSRFNSLRGASRDAFLAYAEDRTGRRMVRQQGC